LPLEFDASFGRALPAIDRGGYLAGADIVAARSVLRAAALTYLASAMLSVLQLARVVR
jgi:Zn-dependent membrane protease YugP